MTAKIVPFRRLELEHTPFGRRHLTPEQRAHRSAMSKRPRRSKNGTPEERAAKVAASVGVEVRAISRSDVLLEPPPLTKEEFKALYIRMTPTQQRRVQEMMFRSVEQPNAS